MKWRRLNGDSINVPIKDKVHQTILDENNLGNKLKVCIGTDSQVKGGTIDKIELEVHADINTDPEFKSNVALKEAMGYILSMGFQFKAKPDAFASSSCADKVV